MSKLSKIDNVTVKVLRNGFVTEKTTVDVMEISTIVAKHLCSAKEIRAVTEELRLYHDAHSEGYRFYAY